MPGDTSPRRPRIDPTVEIVLLRPGFTLDHNPGWEWVLRHVQKATGWNNGQITVFAVITLLLGFFFSALPWLPRPEAWLAALLAELIALPYLMNRLVQCRPLLIPESILIALLFVWSKTDPNGPSWRKIILTGLAFGLATWMDGHGFCGDFCSPHLLWRGNGTSSFGCWPVGRWEPLSPPP